MSDRLSRIRSKNREFERESPYNFCDRWCERCRGEKQIHCLLYHDELEQKMLCLAHGRDPDDPEITEKVMARQLSDREAALRNVDNVIDEESNSDEGGEGAEAKSLYPKEGSERARQHALSKTAGEYRSKAEEALEVLASSVPDCLDEIETLAWYHTLLHIKAERAMAGFDDAKREGDLALYDAVAQADICQKGIALSIEALMKINNKHPDKKDLTAPLATLLQRMKFQILQLEEKI